MGLAAAILTLSACSESEDLLSAFHSDPNAVRITAQVGKASADGFTRSYPQVPFPSVIPPAVIHIRPLWGR